MLVQDRGVAVDVLAERGVGSVEDSLAFMNLGFRLSQWSGPGIIFNSYAPNGLTPTVSHLVYRPDGTTGGKYINPAGSKARLDVPPRCHADLKDPNVTLYVTEGIPKGDSLASRGLCAVVLSGVDSFGWRREPGLPILEDWRQVPLNNRRARIVFDSDADRNPHVTRARLRLTSDLHDDGALVDWIRLPNAPDGTKQGIDDWFAAGHTIAELDALVVAPDPDPILAAPLDDLGNAERFAYINADRARWCYQQKRWAMWNERRWDTTNQERVDRFAKETVRQTQIAVARLPNAYSNRDALVRHVSKMGAIASTRAMTAMARHELAIGNEALDTDPMLLNCLNGTIDLRTGELLPHDPNNLITLMAPVEYDPDARLEEWDRLVEETTEGKEGLAAFLQVALGYSTTGDTSEEKVLMPLGKTRTGKSTIIEAVRATLGDYAATANFATFTRKRDDSTAREDIARLVGKRFVSSIEVEEGKVLADAVIKLVSGGDTVAARFLYQDTFEFVPQLKLWLVANDEPKIDQANEAMWERVLRIPFDNYVPPEKRDKGLKARLKDPAHAGPAILAWLVQGALRWQAEGLVVPACVTNSTAEYRDRMDPLDGFIEDECVVSEGARYPARDCFPAYTAWARRNNLRAPLGRNSFNAALRSRGLEQKRDVADGHKYWVGISPMPLASSTGTTAFERKVEGIPA
jgi:putative DNA primase/helicase